MSARDLTSADCVCRHAITGRVSFSGEREAGCVTAGHVTQSQLPSTATTSFNGSAGDENPSCGNGDGKALTDFIRAARRVDAHKMAPFIVPFYLQIFIENLTDEKRTRSEVVRGGYHGE